MSLVASGKVIWKAMIEFMGLWLGHIVITNATTHHKLLPGICGRCPYGVRPARRPPRTGSGTPRPPILRLASRKLCGGKLAGMPPPRRNTLGKVRYEKLLPQLREDENPDDEEPSPDDPTVDTDGQTKFIDNDPQENLF